MSNYALNGDINNLADVQRDLAYLRGIESQLLNLQESRDEVHKQLISYQELVDFGAANGFHKSVAGLVWGRTGNYPVWGDSNRPKDVVAPLGEFASYRHVSGKSKVFLEKFLASKGTAIYAAKHWFYA